MTGFLRFQLLNQSDYTFAEVIPEEILPSTECGVHYGHVLLLSKSL